MVDNHQVLELGTGVGLSLSWMIEGLDKNSKIVSIDNDPNLINIAKSFFGDDPRIKLICEDGSAWITAYQGTPEGCCLRCTRLSIHLLITH